MKNSVEFNRAGLLNTAEQRESVDTLLGAIAETFADALADRLDQRQTQRRRLLDMDQTVEYLGMSERTIQRLVANKKLIPVRLDDRPRFDIRDLDQLISSSKR